MDPDEHAPGASPWHERLAAVLSPTGQVGPLQPRAAFVIGTVLVAAAAAITAMASATAARTIAPLLLVVPVIAAAIVGGQRPAMAVALEAAVALTFFLPPAGSVRVHAGEDLVAVLVFSLVAVVTGRLVAQVVTAQLARASNLEAIEVQRRGLLRAVSHDLRSPLTTIRAAATELASPEGDAATRRELVDLVADESERLDRLVANLLNMSRIEAGALRLDVQPIDITHLVESALVRLRRLTRDVRLEADIADDVPFVDGDGVQLEQVLTNLIENAVRHSPPGGRVVVAVSTAGYGMVRVSVADEGAGLPSGDPDELFAPFSGVSSGGTSGVGLAICRAIVEQHGGTISGGNRESGGAEFAFVLPQRDPERDGQDPRRR